MLSGGSIKGTHCREGSAQPLCCQGMAECPSQHLGTCFVAEGRWWQEGGFAEQTSHVLQWMVAEGTGVAIS